MPIRSKNTTFLLGGTLWFRGGYPVASGSRARGPCLRRHCVRQTALRSATQKPILPASVVKRREALLSGSLGHARENRSVVKSRVHFSKAGAASSRFAAGTLRMAHLHHSEHSATERPCCPRISRSPPAFNQHLSTTRLQHSGERPICGLPTFSHLAPSPALGSQGVKPNRACVGKAPPSDHPPHSEAVHRIGRKCMKTPLGLQIKSSRRSVISST